MIDCYECCICKHCAFVDACPSAYFPLDKNVCKDLRDMRMKKKDALPREED